MIHAIGKIFKKENKYAILFVCLVLLYGVLLVFFNASEQKQDTSPAVKKFRQAETKWQTEIQRSGGVEKLYREKPVMALMFNIISFFLLGAFSVGLIFDFFLMFRPNWRRSIMRRGPPDTIVWPIGMFYKVAVLWILVSMALSLVLGLVKSILIPGISYNFYILTHTTIMDILIVVFIFVVIKENHGHWRDVGFWLTRKDIVKEIGVGFAGYMAILPVFFIVLIFLIVVAKLLSYEPEAHPLVEIFLEEDKRSPMLIVYSVFLASVVGPIIEEIFFRGFCYPILKNKIGMGWAMAVTAAFFAFIHQNQFAFWPIFILGMGLAFLYEKRRSLVAPITLHIVHNCFFLTYFFLTKQVILDLGV